MASINASTAGVGGVITTADNTGILNIQTGGTTAITVNASQNVGIGVSSPTCKLDVRGNTFKIYDSGTTNASVVVRNSTTGDSAGLTIQQDGVNTLLYNSSNGYMAFATNATERMRIDSSGNLLVGTTSASARLYVADSRSTNASYAFGVSSAVSGNGLLFVRSDGYVQMEYTYNALTSAAGANMVIGSGGYIYRSTSALKYKTDVRDLESIDINKFRPVRYKSKCTDDDANKDFFGVIADEVDAAGIKELVTYGETGEVEGFQYERLTVVLLKAIQEQQAMIQELKAEIDLLKGVK